MTPRACGKTAVALLAVFSAGCAATPAEPPAPASRLANLGGRTGYNRLSADVHSVRYSAGSVYANRPPCALGPVAVGF